MFTQFGHPVQNVIERWIEIFQFARFIQKIGVRKPRNISSTF